MSTGIGKYCQICGDQLNYDEGFNAEETLCETCQVHEVLIPKVLRYIANKGE